MTSPENKESELLAWNENRCPTCGRVFQWSGLQMAVGVTRWCKCGTGVASPLLGDVNTKLQLAELSKKQPK